MSLLFRILANAVALFAASRIVPGITYRGDAVSLLMVAVTFGLVNTLVKPVVKILSIPAIIVTLGLFLVVINASMLMLTARFAQSVGMDFRVDGLQAAIVGAIFVSVASVVLTMIFRDDDA